MGIYTWLKDLVADLTRPCATCGSRFHTATAHCPIHPYEAEGQIVRLPHPLATWPVHVAPLDAADRAAMVAAWNDMDEARERARHKQRLHRLAAGRRAAGG